jgi:hypothetical protein
LGLFKGHEPWGHDLLQRNEALMKMEEKSGKLQGLLCKKLLVYQHYLHLTQKLRNVFLKEDWDRVNTFLSERRNSIKKIGRIDTALLKIEINDTKSLGRFDRDFDERIEDQIHQLRRTAEAIFNIEEELLKLANSKSRHLKEQLLNLRDFRKATREYGRFRENASKFISRCN